MSYYTAVLILSWMALGVLSVLVWENDRLDNNIKWIFCLTYLAVAASALAEWVGLYLNGDPTKPIWMLKLAKCADYSLTPLAGAALAAQLRYKGVWRKWIQIFVAINIVLQVVSAFTGWMIKIDENHVYSRGPLYFLYSVMYIIIIVLLGMEFIDYGREFRNQNVVSLYATLVLVLLGIAMQEAMKADEDIRTAYLALTFGMALLYIHTTEFAQLRADDIIREKEFQIMMGQIQPHFLFNCLTVIRETYRQNEEKGEEAINKFADFLRYNMDSLTKDEAIPFEDELEHVKHYVWLQKLRFEDELEVIFDLECTDFLIPTLTLQPIVENAITYGVRKQMDRDGIVTIQTREYRDRYEIKVIDNGPGFVPDDMKNDKKRSHVGIKNVKERLKSTGKGSLHMESVIGKGTIATIVLAK